MAGKVTWGADEIEAGLSNDRGDASRGDNEVYGDIGAGGSSLAGGGDQLCGGPGNDLLVGDADRLLPSAQGGFDFLDGGAGDDVSIGDGLLQPGADGLWDTLTGGPGDDRLYGDGPIGADAEQSGGTAGAAPRANNQDGGEDRLDGGQGDDLLVGGAGPDDLIGGEGRDVFLFFPSVEDFRDGAEDRTLDFEQGDDLIDLTWWDLDGVELDTNGDGIVDDADDIVAQDGADLVIHLDASTLEDAGPHRNPSEGDEPFRAFSGRLRPDPADRGLIRFPSLPRLLSDGRFRP